MRAHKSFFAEEIAAASSSSQQVEDLEDSSNVHQCGQLRLVVKWSELRCDTE